MKPQNALEIIAAKEGISLEEVRREIQLAIDDAMKNPDPKVQAEWRKIPKKGKKPTPEEVIEFVSKAAIARTYGS